MKLAYLVTHPIQYQAPVLREISKSEDIELHVLFCSAHSTGEHFDPEFGNTVSWDIPLVEGYSHEFLPALVGRNTVSWLLPINYGLRHHLRTHRYDAIWIHGYARFYSAYAIWLAKRLSLKVLLRDDQSNLHRQRSWLKRQIKRAYFKWLQQSCDAFLCSGTRNMEYFKSMGITPDKCFLLPHVVDNEFFRSASNLAESSRAALKQELGIETHRPVILFVGKLISVKRVEDLLEAYISLSPDGECEPHPYLVIVGDGDQRQSLLARATQHNWNSIKFVGFKTQKELPRYYDLCDIFVLPSASETWGFSVNEAMNAGCALVLSDQVGCGDDLLRSGENGFSFAAGNVQQLREALARISEDEVLAREMAMRSKEIIEAWDSRSFISQLRVALSAVASQ